MGRMVGNGSVSLSVNAATLLGVVDGVVDQHSILGLVNGGKDERWIRGSKALSSSSKSSQGRSKIVEIIELANVSGRLRKT